MADGPCDRRWEQGTPHHMLSTRVIRAIMDMDTHDEAQLKVGGDGDYGETLMYLLDEYIEQNGCCPGCGHQVRKDALETTE